MWVSPVGDLNSRQYPNGNWRISNPFLSYYKLGNGYCFHTGHDINLPGVQDVNEPVYAVGDGTVIYARVVPNSTWLGLVVIKHQHPKFGTVYTRYAHMRNLKVIYGDKAEAGDTIGFISPTAGTVATFEPHVHFDVSSWNDDVLEVNPTNWPGLANQFIAAHYQDPAPFMKARLLENDGEEIPVSFITETFKVDAYPSLSVRAFPGLNGLKITQIPRTKLVTASKSIKVDVDGYTWTYVQYGATYGWSAVADKDGTPWLLGFPVPVP